MRIQEFSAKKVEDAIESGLSQMGIDKSRAKITVLDNGGFLRKAKVRIEDLGSEGEKALSFIEGLYEKMGVKCTCELKEDEEGATINVISVDSSAVIGYRGDILDAVQYLASIYANEGKEEFKRIVVDCEEYRSRRVETLEKLAKKTADKAVKNGRPVRLEPMNAFERRIIHSALVDDDRVTTSSFGEEPSRYLVVTPKNLRPRNNKNGNGRFGKGGNKFDRKDRKDGFKKDGERGERRGGFERRGGAPRKSKSTPIEGGFAVYGFYGNSGAKDENKDKE